jgi:cytochrome c peroxidase
VSLDGKASRMLEAAMAGNEFTSNPGSDRCGVDGLAIAADGNVLVWCSFSRRVARLETIDGKGRLVKQPKLRMGPELVASSLDATHHLGMVLFHTADPNISEFAGMACANCHLEGRSDGLSWRIQQRELQTPMLAGRMVGTQPFKWDGDAKDLPTSIRATVERLGGSGLSRKHVAALAAYLEGLPAVRTPTRDAPAIARGRALFESAELGCTGCHDGAAYTDQQRHEFGPRQRGTRRDLIDTPSLVGLAASAPYFHDGSAATLEVLLRDHGTVHGMVDGATELTDAQIRDLVAFLESL